MGSDLRIEEKKKSRKSSSSPDCKLPRSDNMNGASTAAKESIKGMASPPARADVVNGGGDAGLTRTEEERAELEDEVQDLRDDRTYHDFIANIVEDKEIVAEEEELDPDFLPPPVVDDKEDQDGAESDISSTLTDFEDDEGEDEKVVPGCSNVESKIPPEALREAEKRFPHFWRTKHAFKTHYREGHYQEEKDPDYKPEQDKEAVDLDDSQDEESAEADVENSGDDRRSTPEAELDSDREEEEFEEDPEAMKAELNELQTKKEKDLKGDVDGLVEMVEYMTVVDMDHVAEDQDEQPGVEGMEDEQTIGDLELDGYVSAEDPDFPEPSKEDFEAASDSQPETDDDDEMADQGMEAE